MILYPMISISKQPFSSKHTRVSCVNHLKTTLLMRAVTTPQIIIFGWFFSRFSCWPPNFSQMAQLSTCPGPPGLDSSVSCFLFWQRPPGLTKERWRNLCYSQVTWYVWKFPKMVFFPQTGWFRIEWNIRLKFGFVLGKLKMCCGHASWWERDIYI